MKEPLTGAQRRLEERIEEAVATYRKAITTRTSCAVIGAYRQGDFAIVERDAVKQDLKRAERYVMGAA